MKYIIFIFIVLFSLNTVFAQICVKDNSFIFNKGTVVYAKGNLELDGANSNFYLRNEGQFLQGGTTPNGDNKGVGNLSVFQEGTANNFGYNYWCSPVGVPVAAAGNNDFQLDQVIKRPSDNVTSQTPTFTSSVDGTTTNTLLTISNRWIYKYIAQNNYSQWNYVGQSGTVLSGLGFTMKGISGSDNTNPGETLANNPGNNQRYDFRGKPNEGTIDIEVEGQSGQYPNRTLTGNPYPSAINLNLFLLENSGYIVDYTPGANLGKYVTGGPLNIIDGNAYFWEHEKPATSHVLVQYIGGYGTYVPNNTNAFSPGTYNNASWNTYTADGSLNVAGGATGSERYKRMFCPVGQGFMVQGKAFGFAKMKNLYRAFRKESAANDSEFNKNSTSVSTLNPDNWDEIPNVAGVDYTQFSKLQVPQIKIHTIINNQFTKEITMAFNPNTTDGFDTAMDAVSYDTSLTNDAYFSINNDSKVYIITTLPFDINKRIPFTLKAGNQTAFKVFVGDIINFTSVDNVYLYDGLTGVYHDIKNSYFETTLPAGIYTNRFEITFKNDALSIPGNTTSTVMVVQNNTNQLLTILNPNLIDINKITLFDITGKLLFNKEKVGSNGSYQYSTASFSDGVYLVKIQSVDGQSKTQKIIVSSN